MFDSRLVSSVIVITVFTACAPRQNDRVAAGDSARPAADSAAHSGVDHATMDHTAMHPGTADSASDSAFAALQKRGAAVMGVDQYTSAHVFESLPDGGRIELQREADDTAGTSTIRRHLTTVADGFRRGDFTASGLVHATEPPGTAVMAARRDRIQYTVRDLPRGGEIRIASRDSAAVAAIHAFLAFQRKEHRAP
jgi:hypothetical protein